jgi:hypothetical protein
LKRYYRKKLKLLRYVRGNPGKTAGGINFGLRYPYNQMPNLRRALVSLSGDGMIYSRDHRWYPCDGITARHRICEMLLSMSPDEVAERLMYKGVSRDD